MNNKDLFTKFYDIITKKIYKRIEIKRKNFDKNLGFLYKNCDFWGSKTALDFGKSRISAGDILDFLKNLE